MFGSILFSDFEEKNDRHHFSCSPTLSPLQPAKTLETYLVLYNQADELREKTEGSLPNKQLGIFPGKCQSIIQQIIQLVVLCDFSEFRNQKQWAIWRNVWDMPVSEVRTLVF